MATKVPALVNYGTKYEVVLERNSQRYLVAYCAGKSKAIMVRAIRQRGAAILAITQLDESAAFTFTSNTSARLGDWIVKFSGRTQKDAICTRTELPYVGTVADEMQHKFIAGTGAYPNSLYCGICGAPETDHRL